MDHYNGHRPHRALALAPPHPTRTPVVSATAGDEARVERRDRLGGLIHEYAAGRVTRFLHLTGIRHTATVDSSEFGLISRVVGTSWNGSFRLVLIQRAA